MNDEVADSARRLFADRDGASSQALWEAVTAAGFTAALLPEAQGGFGATVAEAMRVLQASAEFAAAIPLAETMLASWLLAGAGLEVPQGMVTLAPVRRADVMSVRREAGGWRVAGSAARVPWGRDAMAVVVFGDDMIACVPRGLFTTTGRDANLAGEPRDTIVIDVRLSDDEVRPAPPGFRAAQWRAAGAAVRTAQIAGALARTLAITVDYVQTRVQFGRPIGKFQAVQHALAVLAGQSASALAAADMAADAFGRGLPLLAIGAAKARAGEAASVAAGLAHQAHGAIGFTGEYRLHPYTRRLWSWRDEFGNESEWNLVIGRAALVSGADGLWPALTEAA